MDIHYILKMNILPQDRVIAPIREIKVLEATTEKNI